MNSVSRVKSKRRTRKCLKHFLTSPVIYTLLPVLITVKTVIIEHFFSW